MVAPDMAAMTIKRHHSIFAAFLLLLACAQGPERVTERRTTQEPAARGLALLKTAMLDGHNRARAAVGSPPLVWDDALAVDARGYAESMARSGRFEHAVQSMGAGHQGENLWTGTRYAFAYGEMVDAWVAEQKDFVNGVTPAFSRTGRWEDVAHYTQIVWPRTTRVGCALASSKSDDYLVCRYSPPGNVVGERVL